ncbi:hypothetical protein GCM10010123_38950 [Pilimelia anulata]|uniref:Teneurin-like YD-shell domain-containing protein n=1 Tax=Pilimelia anulata TaxID=53371 RepID=A0A8J3FCC4_9ACTN|nr:RHS repeat-associated core domain-containing protein [Pilimelia anulata]GGK05292.1 hypothetical protein GCM10010123_38950 [Pilimelia anulata]
MVAAGLLPGLPAAAQDPDDRRPGVQEDKAARVRYLPLRGGLAEAGRPQESDVIPDRPIPDSTLPTPGSAVVELGAVGSTERRQQTVLVGSLPVLVGPPRTDDRRRVGDVPAKVRLEVYPTGVAARAGITGVLLRATRADGVQAPGNLSLELDYSGFARAIGGDWANRLRLSRLPSCVVADTPDPGCDSTPAEVFDTWNRAEGRWLGANLPVEAEPAGRDGAGQVFSLAAGASGPGGSYAATSLSPAGSWQVGGNTGSFSWQYPMRVPPALAGPSPELSLNYTSASVDGRTGSTNAQPSWAGEGFELSVGHIERSYRSCKDDGHDEKGKEKYDLCWPSAGDHLTMSFGGRNGELVRKGPDEWRLKADDGTRIQRRRDGFNGDDNKEYFVVTTTDGVRYVFGRGKRYAADTINTNSAWQVPVYGDDKGEPCYDKGDEFKNRRCNQTWRWNLDYVVDTHDNTMTYFWEKETNRYGTNRDNKEVVGYDRGGYLSRIEYGERAGREADTRAPMQVDFTIAERCIVDKNNQCGDLNEQTWKRWPDVPQDLICGENAKECKQKWSPAFFTRKRLASVTTKVLRGDKLEPVDSWTLSHSFPDNGDGSTDALWLKSVTHTGHVGGKPITMPPTVFEGEQLPNRVDADGDDRLEYVRWRIRAIQTESGGVTALRYKSPECRAGDKRDPKRNTARCFPSFWSKEGTIGEKEDWFHKYVVESVVEDDRVGNNSQTDAKETRYEYHGGAAWHFDENELAKSKERTWNQFRGFQRVVTVTGGSSRTASTFLRGMDGDKGRPEVRVRASDGTEVVDDDRLQGFLLEQQTYDRDREISGSVHTPWLSAPTATEGSDRARLVAPGTTSTRTALDGGSHRRTRVVHSHDGYGMLERSEDLGDIGADGQNKGAAAADDSCTRYTYSRNPAANLLTLVSRVETVSVRCDREATYPDHVVSDVRTYYDKATSLTGTPTKGDVTRTDELAGYDAERRTVTHVTVSRSAYDGYGRVISATDAKGRTTKTSFTAGPGGPVTGMTVTDPLNHRTVSRVDPAWGEVVGTTDANGATTTLERDALGRLVKVWLPGRATSETPNTQYEYLVRQNKPVAVVTRTLKPNGVRTSYEIYDALLRPRQTQAVSTTGKRIITDTYYDKRGLAIRSRGPYFAAGAPADTLVDTAAGVQAPTTVTTYDGAGRPTVEAFHREGAEQPETWRTATSYHGDHTVVDPPEGETATATYSNAQGLTTKLVEYRTPSPTGDEKDGDVTTYEYDHADRLSTVTASRHVWSFRYDLRGRQVTATDPDAGTTTMTYDELDRLATSTDARARTLRHEYDKLGRPVAVHEGDRTLSAWAYDKATNGKGRLASSTRYTYDAAGTRHAYTTTVGSYDAGGRPLATSVSIPAVENNLAGEYKYTAAYAVDGSPSTATVPGVGGLPAETLETEYDTAGLPITLQAQGRDAPSYVRESRYSEFGEPLQYTLGSTADKTKYTWLTHSYEHGTRRLQTSQVDRYLVKDADSVVSYGYDAAGNVLRIADRPKNAPADVQCFRYDHVRRLTEAWAQEAEKCATAPSVAALGKPASPYWQSFTHDAAGNRRTQVDHAVTPDEPEVTRAYTPRGPAGFPAHAVDSVDVTTKVKGSEQKSRWTFDYDKSGNMTKRQAAADADQKIDWNAEGHVERLTAKDGKATSFVYDADGNRLLRRDQADQSVTLYLGAEEIRLDTRNADPAKQSTAGTRYYTHNGQAVAVRTVTGLSWLAGGQNGTSEIAVANGTLELTRQRTKPFGELRGPDSPLPGERGFVGGTNDRSIGLIHLGAREYDPASGRFISPDPVLDFADPQQLNGYAYGRGNPLSFADPSGLWWGSGWNWNMIGHGALDVIGLIPVVGEVADLANGAWYFAEGDWVNGSLSMASAIPVAGYVATAAKGAKYVDEAVGAVKVAQDVTKAGDSAKGAAKAADNAVPPAAPAPKAAPKPNPPAASKSAGSGAKKADGGGGPAAGAKSNSGKSGSGGKGTSRNSSTAKGQPSQPKRDGDLVDAVNGAYDEIVASQSIKQRGPVVSGVKDRLTGEIAIAQNSKSIPNGLHPELAGRLMMTGKGAPFKGTPGSHGEIHALNGLLWKREASGMSTAIDDSFSFFSRRLRGSQQGAQILRCGNCRNLTWGGLE